MKFLSKAQRAALYLFFFSINFEMWDPFNSGESFSIAKLTGIIYLMTIGPQIMEFMRIDRLKSILFPLWIFWGLLVFIGIININELYADFFYFPLFLNIIFFWLLINHERKDFMIIEKGMIWFAIGSVGIVLLFFAGIGVEYIEGRVSIFGDNQNTLGIKVTVSTIVLLLAVIQNRLNLGWTRFLFLVPIPFMLYFVGETGSRVSIISFTLAFIAGSILYKTKANLTKIGILIGSAVVLTLIGVLLMQSEIIIERLVKTSSSGDLGSRDMIWKTILPIIEENPILGIGKTGYDFQSVLLFGIPRNPHNVILEILCYTGIVGLFIFLAFIFQLFKKSYQSYLESGWLLSLLLVFPILGMFISGHILGTKICWAIFAYMVSTSAIPYNKKG
jgi:O-antigen ligase